MLVSTPLRRSQGENICKQGLDLLEPPRREGTRRGARTTIGWLRQKRLPHGSSNALSENPKCSMLCATGAKTNICRICRAKNAAMRPTTVGNTQSVGRTDDTMNAKKSHNPSRCCRCVFSTLGPRCEALVDNDCSCWPLVRS